MSTRETNLPAFIPSGQIRIDALIRLPDGAGRIINRAKVSAREGCGWIEWLSSQVDARLHRGGFAVAIPMFIAPAVLRPLYLLLPLDLGNAISF